MCKHAHQRGNEHIPASAAEHFLLFWNSGVGWKNIWVKTWFRTFRSWRSSLEASAGEAAVKDAGAAIHLPAKESSSPFLSSFSLWSWTAQTDPQITANYTSSWQQLCSPGSCKGCGWMSWACGGNLNLSVGVNERRIWKHLELQSSKQKQRIQLRGNSWSIMDQWRNKEEPNPDGWMDDGWMYPVNNVG